MSLPLINNSVGTQLNRLLDSLGLDEKFGDAVGTVADLQTGNVPGAIRNLIDLSSGISTRELDRYLGCANRRGFGRCFVARRRSHEAHLGPQNGYRAGEQVGKRAHIGQQYGIGWGPFHETGRITGKEYLGSFAKPIKLENGDFLYRGRTYDSLGDIWRDARDGQVDGMARQMPPGIGGQSRLPLGWMRSGFGGLDPSRIKDLFGANGLGQQSGTEGATTSSGGGNISSVLSNPNMTLEEKLAVLMAELSEHLDEKIEEKMGEVEKAMAEEKSESSSGSSSAGSNGNGASATGSSEGSSENSSNLQLLQTQLQQLMEQRQQMFQTMSSIFKSLHDTSMNAIRNLKA